jgi:hypothetical protein
MPKRDKKAGIYLPVPIYAPSPYVYQQHWSLAKKCDIVNHECNDSQVSPSQLEQISFSSYFFFRTIAKRLKIIESQTMSLIHLNLHILCMHE